MEIKTEEEYEIVSEKIGELLWSPFNVNEIMQIDKLMTAMHSYEEEHHPIDKPK